jgi:uncharacterized LabA/DUF88 family protein
MGFSFAINSRLMLRVSAFIDGFNLYHALKRLNGDHLLWVDLWALMERQLLRHSESLQAVYYFSAYATWLPEERERHESYVAALEGRGVTPVMGHFKEKDRKCPNCNNRWKGHEEKETDVNIALHLLNQAYKNRYDKALLVTRDSDLKPAVEMVRREFPDKNITVVAPPHLGHSTDLTKVASAKRKITKAQVEECLLPQTIHDASGRILAVRPVKYDPPAPPSVSGGRRPAAAAGH